jgi:hypothetical protein
MPRKDTGDTRGAYADYLRVASLNSNWQMPRAELARITLFPAPTN